MSDPIFFLRDAQLTLAELVALTGAHAPPGADLSPYVYGGAPVEEAEAGDLACFADPERLDLLAATHATACFLNERFAAALPARTAALVTESPRRAFALAITAMYASALRPGSLFAAAGVNPGAAIHPEARLEPGVVIDPGVVVGPRAEIGSGTIIAAGSVIGPGVRLGRECRVGAQTTIVNALIGNRVLLHPGVRLGQAGLDAGEAGGSEAPAPPQIGRVIVQDDVEIGANSTIDRGFCRDTVIGEGARIGNLVQIGCDVTVGRKCMILSQAAIGPASRLADFARVGKRSGD